MNTLANTKSTTKNLRVYNFKIMAGGTIAEKLNYKAIPICLSIFALLAILLQTIYSPIQCSMPKEFSQHQADNTLAICWRKNTYYPLMSEIPPPTEIFKRVERTRKTVLYQYVPLLLLIQLVFFLIPLIAWRSGMSIVGVRLETLYHLADGYTKQTRAERKAIAQQLAVYIKQWVQQSLLGGCCWGFITLLMMFVKLLTLINIITQFSIVDGFLKAENETTYGDQLSRNLWTRNPVLWRNSPAFPKNILCDYEIRKMQNIQRWTFQCILTANIYQEQMYALVWILLCLSLAVTIGDFITHGIKIIIPMIRTRYVQQHLQVNTTAETRFPITDAEISNLTSILGQDGVTILEFIASTSSDLVVSDIVGELWMDYKLNSSSQQGIVLRHNQQQPFSLPPPQQPTQPINPGYHVPPPAGVYPSFQTHLPNYNEASRDPEQIPLMQQGDAK